MLLAVARRWPACLRRPCALQLPSRRGPRLSLHQHAASQLGFARTHGRRAQDVEKILADMPGVEYTTSIVGFSLLSFVRTSYNGFFFVTLKPWGERKTKEEQYQEIKARLNAN